MSLAKASLLAATVLLGAVLDSNGVEAGRKELKGHVPHVISSLTPVGILNATNQLYLAIGLPLRNTNELEQFLHDVSDPASPNYRKFLTPEEFTARFGPTEADYEAIKNFARTNGLKIAGTSANRLLLDVTGSAAAVEQAFHVTLHTYHHPTEKRDFYAPDTEPEVDTGLPIVDVSGLDNYTRPHPGIHPASMRAKPNNGSAPDGSSLLGNDFRNAYAPGVTLTGASQSIGLFQADGFYSSDITAYAKQAGGGRTNIVLQTVLFDGFSGTPTTGANSGNGEVSLDIEMAMSMAPGLSRIILFEGNPNNFIPNDMLNAMAASNTVKNLSSSWGWSGGPSTSTDNIYKTMAAQGQSFFNAAGDSDAFTVGSGSVNGVDNTSLDNAPSSSPYITQVGGTTLTMSGTGASYASETAWNWGYDSNAGAYVGTSGGISSYYSIPGWQTGISMTANLGSTTNRNIPDVALTADQVYVYYGNGTTGVFGGTSCAAPLWAGFMALVNQQLVINTGKATNSVGFINPAIYAIGNGSNAAASYASCFHDTTTGNNFSSNSPANYPAVTGYDLCTGWGTPNGQAFINALAGPADPLGVTPISGFTATGFQGGPFLPASQIYILTNSGVAGLNWSVINTSAWLNVFASSGSLAAGAQTGVTAGISTSANNLGVGNYSTTLIFSNQTSGVAHAFQFFLQISDPLVLLTTSGFTTASGAGSAFTPGSESILFTNLSAGAIPWSLINTASWLSVSSSSGSLAGDSSFSVTVSTNSNTMALPLGTYSATLLLSNQTSHLTRSLASGAVVGASLVLNGGFETGDFTFWTLNGDGGTVDLVTNSYTYNIGSSRHPNDITITPHGGNFDALLGETGKLGYISQPLPTIAGQLYLVSLWMDSPDGETPNEFSVAWNGNTLFDQSNMPKLGWTNLQFIVTATGSSTTLQIGGRDDPTFLALDDVSASPVYAPSFVAQPASLILAAGSTAAFMATVNGSTNLTYRWCENGTNISNGANISGATSNILTLTAITAGSAANYTLVVTNAYGAATSSVATLTVLLPPSLASSSLTNRTSQCGLNLNTYTVAAAGTAPLSIQWSLDATPIAGATNTTFSLTNLFMPNHTVGVVITNLYGSLASNTTLTVIDTLAPVITLNGAAVMTNELGSAFSDPGATAFDACAGTVPVTTNGTVNVNAVSTNVITYKAADGNGNTNTATRTVFVRDTTPPTILWSFTNLLVAASSNCVALMTNVTGTNFIRATDLSGTLTITQIPTNNAALPLGTNVVVITVADASGNKSFSTNQVVVTDQTPPQMVLQPQSQTNVVGASASFSAGATACTPLAYQWYLNNGILAAQTNVTLALSGLTTNIAGNYFAVASATGGSSTSQVATLVVNIPPPGFGGLAANVDGSFTLNLMGSPGYTYVLLSATNLGADWLPLATNTLGTNGVWQFTDFGTSNNPDRFYRLLQQ
ncbi:MAG TPA: protease pro-enzyme activation domain-containing protein [Candidatus Sulfotelmatobacter sp.]|jgi:hypothetical protein|nr:protease pro-enzyme activation domain-containing protein [Candidatus Sulfotelmatobacter sp.]